jgi:hypothetical protein
VGFDSNLVDATHTGELVFDSALASAQSSIVYDSTTQLLDASIATSLKVGDGSVTFSQPSFVTGKMQGITMTLESPPKQFKGSTRDFDLEGAIGLKIEANVTNDWRPLPVPVRVPRSVPGRVPQTSVEPMPFGIPQGVLVTPIIVPSFIFRKWFLEGGPPPA